jgi:prefoldin subunit 2
VIETLDPLPQDRKCFRMVNGVLVERTVKDVLPTLKTNSDGLKQVLEDMLKQYKSKQTELDSWKVSPCRIYQRVHLPRVFLEYEGIHI